MEWGDTSIGWIWFKILGVISGELVLISMTLLREKLLVWKWRACLWSTALYIRQAPLPRGQSICGATLRPFAHTLLDSKASSERRARQQPSCAADLKQLPSQALSTLGRGELAAARGQALMLPPPSPSYHTEQICWLTKCDYPQPFIMLLVRRVTEREYLKKSANPRLSRDPRIVLQNNSCTILSHS